MVSNTILETMFPNFPPYRLYQESSDRRATVGIQTGPSFWTRGTCDTRLGSLASHAQDHTGGGQVH